MPATPPSGLRSHWLPRCLPARQGPPAASTPDGGGSAQAASPLRERLAASSGCRCGCCCCCCRRWCAVTALRGATLYVPREGPPRLPARRPRAGPVRIFAPAKARPHSRQPAPRRLAAALGGAKIGPSEGALGPKRRTRGRDPRARARFSNRCGGAQISARPKAPPTAPGAASSRRWPARPGRVGGGGVQWPRPAAVQIGAIRLDNRGSLVSWPTKKLHVLILRSRWGTAPWLPLPRATVLDGRARLARPARPLGAARYARRHRRTRSRARHAERGRSGHPHEDSHGLLPCFPPCRAPARTELSYVGNLPPGGAAGPHTGRSAGGPGIVKMNTVSRRAILPAASRWVAALRRRAPSLALSRPVERGQGRARARLRLLAARPRPPPCACVRAGVRRRSWLVAPRPSVWMECAARAVRFSLRAGARARGTDGCRATHGGGAEAREHSVPLAAAQAAGGYSRHRNSPRRSHLGIARQGSQRQPSTHDGPPCAQVQHPPRGRTSSPPADALSRARDAVTADVLQRLPSPAYLSSAAPATHSRAAPWSSAAWATASQRDGTGPDRSSCRTCSAAPERRAAAMA
eukprot:scaffold1213_cov350-Prasinococcus_capsulatus_cf.AAC.10